MVRRLNIEAIVKEIWRATAASIGPSSFIRLLPIAIGKAGLAAAEGEKPGR
jgi:hypothetical protein